MKKKYKIIFLVIFIFSVFTSLSFSASYHINSLIINADIKNDGSLEVNEKIKYDIDEINGIFFNIDAKNFGKLKNLEIFEDDRNGNFSKVASDRYEIYLDDDLYKIKLYSRNFNNQREFIFHYVLDRTIILYDDVAEFNRKMIGSEWQQGIDYVEVNIKIPVDKNYDSEKILAFGHGPLSGELIKEENKIKYILYNYSPGEFLESHILMEPSIFSGISKSEIIHQNMKEELLANEKKLALEANKTREEAIQREKELEKLKSMSIIFIAVEFLIWLASIFYLKFIFTKGKKYENEYGEYFREAPDNYSPSLAGTILNDRPAEKEILATLLDLVRRKILSLETLGNKTILTLENKNPQLTVQEKILLDIYINDFGDGEKLILEDVKNGSLNVARKFEKWRYQILTEMQKKGFYFEKLNLFPKFLFLIFGFILFFGTVFQTMLFENPISMFLPFLGIVLINTVLSSKRPCFEFVKAKTRWKAFKNFLSDYSLLSEANINSINLWEQYFVYAVAMGVSEKVLKAYKKALEMGKVEVNQNNFNILDRYTRNFYLIDNLSRMTSYTYNKSMRDLSEISRSKMSSFTGGSGGFSGGSSGGGGGRGGGGAF